LDDLKEKYYDDSQHLLTDVYRFRIEKEESKVYANLLEEEIEGKD